jgi:hypothetical protein
LLCSDAVYEDSVRKKIFPAVVAQRGRRHSLEAARRGTAKSGLSVAEFGVSTINQSDRVPRRPIVHDATG